MGRTGLFPLLPGGRDAWEVSLHVKTSWQLVQVTSTDPWNLRHLEPSCFLFSSQREQKPPGGPRPRRASAELKISVLRPTWVPKKSRAIECQKVFRWRKTRCESVVSLKSLFLALEKVFNFRLSFEGSEILAPSGSQGLDPALVGLVTLILHET